MSTLFELNIHPHSCKQAYTHVTNNHSVEKIFHGLIYQYFLTLVLGSDCNKEEIGLKVMVILYSECSDKCVNFTMIFFFCDLFF